MRLPKYNSKEAARRKGSFTLVVPLQTRDARAKSQEEASSVLYFAQFELHKFTGLCGGVALRRMGDARIPHLITSRSLLTYKLYISFFDDTAS